MTATAVKQSADVVYQPGSVVKIRGNERVLQAENPAEAERFIEEMNYLDFYLREIGRVLGMRAVQMGVVEEDSQQIAFKHYALVQSSEIETHGVFFKRHQTFRALLSNMP